MCPLSSIVYLLTYTRTVGLDIIESNFFGSWYKSPNVSVYDNSYVQYSMNLTCENLCCPLLSPPPSPTCLPLSSGFQISEIVVQACLGKIDRGDVPLFVLCLQKGALQGFDDQKSFFTDKYIEKSGRPTPAPGLCASPPSIILLSLAAASSDFCSWGAFGARGRAGVAEAFSRRGWAGADV